MTQQEFNSVSNNPLNLLWFAYNEKCLELKQETLVRPDSFFQCCKMYYESINLQALDMWPFEIWLQINLPNKINTVVIPYLKTKIK